MNASSVKVKDIFLAAADLTQAERPGYLDSACAGDEALRRDVDEMLEHHGQLGSFLLSPVGALVSTINEQPVLERPGTVIGHYKLMEEIGEGGMGLVFVAEQQRPVRRKVALKVIKPGMDTRQVVARFEAERQALALMDHPNIAKILDGGETGSGRPYFVMELVKGFAVTEFCDRGRLGVRDRLSLFVDVCSAVQHAHQKGIIHRDIKPSNVLVSLHDDRAVVKVIDFGVAKALGQELTDKTLFTGFSQMVGTPLYMSPEQARMSGPDADTRSDVYSLGVLLYELLTGATPFDKERMQTAGYDEIRRIIREEEPARPSTRLSTLGQAAATACANRGSDPKRLCQLMRGELDWVVMKSLEKDRERRYESASAFAADVRRYLGDEPVLACPPAVGYRLRKLMRRHKGPALATLLVLLALTGGTVSTAWQAVRAEQGRRAEARRAEGERLAKLDAEEAREQEAIARRKAEEAEKQARESEADYLAFSRFLVEDVLSAPRPHPDRGGRGVDVTVKQALIEAAGRVPARFRGRPRAEGVARHDLGVTFRLMGELAAAEEQLRLALALRIQGLPAADPVTSNTRNSLAVLLVERGKVGEAIPLFEETLKSRRAKLGPDHAHTLSTMDNLANAYRCAGRVSEALPLFEEALARMKEKLGPRHPDTLITLGNMALAYGAAGRLDKKLSILEKAVGLAKTVFGADHPETLTVMNNLAVAYWEGRKAHQAIPLLEQAVELRVAKLGPDHSHTLVSLRSLAFMYTRFAVGPEFQLYYLERLPQLRDRLTDRSPVWLAVVTATADQFLSDRNYAGAEPLLLAGYEGMRRREAEFPPPSRVRLTEALERMVQLYTAWGKKDKADEWRNRLDAHRQKGPGTRSRPGDG